MEGQDGSLTLQKIYDARLEIELITEISDDKPLACVIIRRDGAGTTIRPNKPQENPRECFANF